jgi:hypothetical protein
MRVHVGDVGRAISPMCPSGAVEVNGMRLDARSDGAFIEAGSPVIVLRGDPTGFVVRRLGPGDPIPSLPNNGERIRRAEFQRTSAEVAEAEREEQAERRRRMRETMRFGSLTAASFGALVGLASGGFGWATGRAGEVGPEDAAILLGGSLAAGAVLGVGLFFLSGMVGSVVQMFDGEPGFSPSFSVIVLALIGTAAGFWWRFETGDVAVITTCSASGLAIGAAAGWVVSWLTAQILGAAAGA